MITVFLSPTISEGGVKSAKSSLSGIFPGSYPNRRRISSPGSARLREALPGILFDSLEEELCTAVNVSYGKHGLAVEYEEVRNAADRDFCRFHVLPSNHQSGRRVFTLAPRFVVY